MTSSPSAETPRSTREDAHGLGAETTAAAATGRRGAATGAGAASASAATPRTLASADCRLLSRRPYTPAATSGHAVRRAAYSSLPVCRTLASPSFSSCVRKVGSGDAVSRAWAVHAGRRHAVQ